MAKQQYQSIIRLLEHLGVDTYAPIQLSRLKKQLTAEFDYSPDGFIVVNEHNYTRHFVFEEIEHPQFEERLVYHRSIWLSAAILHFLEKNQYDPAAFKDQLKKFEGDPAFDVFFSPYFSVSFAYLMRNLLLEHRFEECCQLLVFDEFIIGEDREDAYKPLRLFLDENLRLFRNLNKENYASFRDKLLHWTKPNWSNMINMLPDDMFEYREQIAFHLVNLTVYIQRSFKKDCKLISYELSKVRELSTELHDTIQSNHRIYTNQSVGTSNGGWGNWGWIIWVVLILLRILSGGC